MLTVSGVTKEYFTETERVIALEKIDLQVAPGEFFSIVGPSGCGKSTLLRIIAGLITPTKGTIFWKEKPNMAFVFQNYALFPYLTVFENIEFGLKMSGVAPVKRREISRDLIEEMGLTGFEDKHPKELSGGMKQRVGIARALAIDPNILLLDEPFSSLDEFTAEELRKLLLSIWKKRSVTIVMVTHLISEALELSDKIAIMSASPGTIKSVLENKLPRPRNLRSKEFFDHVDKIVSLIKG